MNKFGLIQKMSLLKLNRNNHVIIRMILLFQMDIVGAEVGEMVGPTQK